MLNKKGLSPVIATMLLVTIVIVLALIVFLWLRGITEEAITKFDGTNVKIICEDIKFEASYSNSLLQIVNTGNVPIYQMRIKIFGDGTYSTQTLTEGWPTYGLIQGGTFEGAVSSSLDRIILIPVLIGHSNKGDMTYTCDERFGYEIEV